MSESGSEAPPSANPGSAQLGKAKAFLADQVRLVRKPVFFASLSIAISAVLMIVQYRFIAEAVGGVLKNRQSLEQLWPFLWPVLILIVCRAALSFATERASALAAAGIRRNLRESLIRGIFSKGPLLVQKTQSGAIASTLVEGVEAISPYFSHYLPAMRAAVLAPLAVMAVVLPTDWLCGAILIGTAPLIPLFMVLIGKGAEKLNQRQWVKLARMSAHFLEVIQNLTTLKLFGAAQREAALIAKISNDYRLATMSVLKIAFLSALALEFFATVGVAILAVIIGFRLMWGEFDFTHGFFILLVAPEFYLPLRLLGQHYHARMEGIGAATRMIDLLSQTKGAAADAAPCSPLPFSAISPPDIAFDSVRLVYDNKAVGLKEASFVIPAGQITALVGPSGGGKSSALSLLLGFVRAESGEIRINGAPFSTLDIDEWRKMVAWAPQKPHLFAGTIADNVRLGQKASLEDCERALRDVGAWSFVKGLPNTLRHQIGEDGSGLSGGQRRLISLARATLKDAPFLMMDEPTASLDSKTEDIVQQAMARLAENRTLLVVAHRLCTIRTAQNIIVLDQGAARESGDYDALLAQDGLFASMVKSGQFIPGER